MAIDRRTALYNAALYNAIYFANEACQQLAIHDIIDYQGWMGYVSDFAAPAVLTSFSLAIFPQGSRLKNFGIATASSLLCTLHESFPVISIASGENPAYDPLDVAAYVAGGLASYASVTLTSKLKKSQNDFKKVE